MKKKLLTVLLLCVFTCGCTQTTATESQNANQETSVSGESQAVKTTAADSAEETKENAASQTVEEISTETITENAKEETSSIDEIQKTTSETVSEASEEVTVEKLGETIRFDFTNGCPAGFEKSGEWTNGSMFNVTWRKKNVSFEDEKMQLIIDLDSKGTSIPYAGGELRSKTFYGYGRYEVSMKAIRNDGVVSSFFTYTGPSDKNPWDEIDVEILGKDTTQVQFNYFTNGKGNHEKVYDLGFDASEDFHTYAFEWRADRIDWFVDGELVHTATAAIPSTDGKIMMNAWCGTGVDEWLKAFDDSNLPLTAEYQWIAFTPFVK